MSEGSLYERLGGEEGIRAVVEEFYDRVLADDALAPLFAEADVAYLEDTLTSFLCAAAGGPERYDGPPVREAHRDVPLEPHHVWRAVSHLGASLEALDVPEEDADKVVNAVAIYEEDLLARLHE